MKPEPVMEDLAWLRAVLVDRTGLQFDDSQTVRLAEVLKGRALAFKVSQTEYLRRLAAGSLGATELALLAGELTVTETYFFRNIEQFDAFVERVLPDPATQADWQGPLRLLCAGCASGEEPYSLAMLVRERIGPLAGRVDITAADLNPNALDKARRGRYTQWSLRATPAEMRQRWFRAVGNEYRVADEIRDAVRFEQRNIACDDPELWPADTYDVIFCRNVLMYFALTQAQALVARICRALRPGGFLFLGHAENLRGLSNAFHLHHSHDTFYYQRKPAGAVADGRARSQAPPLRVAPPPLDGETTWVDTIQRATHRIRNLTESQSRTGASAGGVAAALPTLQRAFNLLHSEQFEQALDVLDTLPPEQALDPDALLLRAVLLTQSGSLAAAEAVCRRLLARDELAPGAHYVLALCREGGGDLDGALEHDQVAIYLDPAFAMAYLHLGLTARRRGDGDLARSSLRQALLSLQQEDGSRLLLFGGGFSRGALVALCRAQLAAYGEGR